MQLQSWQSITDLLELAKVVGVHCLRVALVKSVTLLLVLYDARVGLTEHLFVETLTETFVSLLHLFLYLLVVFGYLVFYQHIGAIAFLRVAIVDKRVVECIDVT